MVWALEFFFWVGLGFFGGGGCGGLGWGGVDAVSELTCTVGFLL